LLVATRVFADQELEAPVEASPAAVKAEVSKLEFLRGLDAHTLDLSVLPAERRRFLATVGSLRI
jgi:hypothetical protein